MKKTWKVINELLNNQRTKSRVLTKLKDPTNNNQITQNPSRLPNILNKHFANVGNLIASKLPKKDNYMSYLSKLKSPDSSFFFKPITQEEVKQEILSLPNNKSCGLYSCPTQLLKYSCNTTSSPGPSPRRFSKWRIVGRRPWHTAEITWPICPRRVEIYSKWRPR